VCVLRSTVMGGISGRGRTNDTSNLTGPDLLPHHLRGGRGGGRGRGRRDGVVPLPPLGAVAGLESEFVARREHAARVLARDLELAVVGGRERRDGAVREVEGEFGGRGGV